MLVAIASGGHILFRGTIRTHRKSYPFGKMRSFLRRDWYLSVGQGMGDTLIMAGEKRVMPDRPHLPSMKDSLDQELIGRRSCPL